MKSLLAFLFSYKLSIATVKKLDWLTAVTICTFFITPSCSFANFPSNSHTAQTNQTLTAENNDNLESERWRKATPEEQKQTWSYMLNSPLGIAALNQLAIEGFISPTCPKTLYIDQKSGGYQTLLQVRCSEGRGVSLSTSYQEMQVIFSRFEDNIEGFQIQRINPTSE